MPKKPKSYPGTVYSGNPSVRSMLQALLEGGDKKKFLYYASNEDLHEELDGMPVLFLTPEPKNGSKNFTMPNLVLELNPFEFWVCVVESEVDREKYPMGKVATGELKLSSEIDFGPRLPPRPGRKNYWHLFRWESI